jgi:hypothetical protein
MGALDHRTRPVAEVVATRVHAHIQACRVWCIALPRLRDVANIQARALVDNRLTGNGLERRPVLGAELADSRRLGRVVRRPGEAALPIGEL